MRIFPLIRLQITAQRFIYLTASNIADTRFGGKLSVHYSQRLTYHLTYQDCDRIEKHYARHGVLPGWSKKMFLSAEDLLFDDWEDKFSERP